MSETREVAPYDREARDIAKTDAEQRVHQTLAMVREAMTNPAVDANKAKVMAELLNSQEDRWQQQEFNRDLNAAMMEMPVITKGGIIKIPANQAKGTPERVQGRFARFEDIDRVVRPILQRHNLAIRFEVGDLNNMVTVCPILSHSNGHTERGGAMRLPLDESGAKNKVQGVGSAVSYGKRYTMCALLNIITEGTDDDGSLGKFNIDMPHERTVTVLEEAECAHEEGRYKEWWAALGVKDRAWMISQGHHARLGGGAELPGPKAPPPPPTPPPPPPPPPASSGPPPARDTSTPQGWADQYVDDCNAADSMEKLETIKRRGARGLERLAADHVKQYDRCDAAFEDAKERLQGSGLFAQGD